MLTPLFVSPASKVLHTNDIVSWHSIPASINCLTWQTIMHQGAHICHNAAGTVADEGNLIRDHSVQVLLSRALHHLPPHQSFIYRLSVRTQTSHTGCTAACSLDSYLAQCSCTASRHRDLGILYLGLA